MGRLRIKTAEETLLFGEKLARLLVPNTIIALSGDLGAGKTTFVQGLAKGLHIEDPIVSPTFVYLNIYEGTLPLFHFDLYRLKSASDFEELGFSEYFHQEGVCAIEWPERIEIPPSALHLHFTYDGEGRMVRLAKDSPNLLYSCLWD